MILTDLGINVNKNCNIDCAMCLCNEPINETITPEVIKRAFIGIDEVEELYISGGEVLLKPSLLYPIKDEIKKQNLKVNQVSITTNATIFNDEVKEALLYLFEGNNACIKVSVDIFHREAVERFYKRKNMKYDDETFSLLVKRYYDFCMDNNIKFEKLDLTAIGIMGRAVTLDKTLYDFPFVFVDNSFRALGNYFPKESLYSDSVMIDTTGNVLRCDYENDKVEKLSIGNVLDDTLENIIYSRCVKELEKRGIKDSNPELLKTAMNSYYLKRHRY